MSFQTGSIDKNGLARTEDGKLYVTSVGTASITGGTITGTNVPYTALSTFAAVTAPNDTNENILATVTIPAGAMGANGSLYVEFHCTVTNNVNAKTINARLGGIGGTVVYTDNYASLAIAGGELRVGNTGAANSQKTSAKRWLNTAFSLRALVTSAIDTSATTTLVLTATKATAGDTFTLDYAVAYIGYAA
jgi:hypothetical protein